MSIREDKSIEIEPVKGHVSREKISLKEKLLTIKNVQFLQKFKDLLIEPILFSLTFIVLWGVCGSCILPPSNYFTLFILYLLSIYFGKLSKLIHLPDLFGMIVAGFLCRNIPQLEVDKTLDPDWSSLLRNMALVVILIRAGMGLDAGVLKKLSCVVFRLALTPCLAEIGTATLMSRLLLNLPWTYGLILGSVLAAVSPAVVVPLLLGLSEDGYGVEKGIPTLVIAASSIDDIFAITLFGIFLGFTFDTGNLLYVALKSPLELLLGVLYGGLVALLLWLVPRNDHKRKVEMRASILLLAGFVGHFSSARLDFAGIGPVGALVMGFVVMIRWNKQQAELPAAQGDNERLSNLLELVWTLLKPFLFVLIGAEIHLAKIDVKLISLGVAILLCGLISRMITTFLVLLGQNLHLKEKIFVTISWLPKATVQAAIGGLTLDRARRKGLSVEEQIPAMTVVTLAVLSIVVTAPLGAILIAKLGPHLLSRSSDRDLSMTSKLRSSKNNVVLPVVAVEEPDEYNTSL